MRSLKVQILLKIPLACLAAFLALASIFIFPLFYSTRTKPTPVIAHKIQLARIGTTDAQPAKPAAHRGDTAACVVFPKATAVKPLVKPAKIPSPAPTKAFIRPPPIQLPVQQSVAPSPVQQSAPSPVLHPESLASTEPIVSESSDFGRSRVGTPAVLRLASCFGITRVWHSTGDLANTPRQFDSASRYTRNATKTRESADSSSRNSRLRQAGASMP